MNVAKALIALPIDSETMRARGIIVSVKSNYSCSWSKIPRQNNFS